MTIASSAPFCVGMTAAAASSYPTTTIAGHEMVEIPGGYTVRGGWFDDAPPHWVWLSPYQICETATSESQYREVMRVPGRADAPESHPVTMVSYDYALDYLEKRGRGLCLPTEAQWENAARGPAVNIPELMEEEVGRFSAADIADFIGLRFENLVFGVRGKIYRSPKELEFQRRIRRGETFFGWRLNGTPSGFLKTEEAWFGKEGETVPVDWGPKNVFGLYTMAGNVWEWMQDWYARGAYMRDHVDPTGPDWGEYGTKVIRGGGLGSGYEKIIWGMNYSEPWTNGCYVAYRGVLKPRLEYGFCGFRVAAPVSAKK